MDSKKKLKMVHLAMLGVGLVMDAVQIGALALWIATGIWWPFAVGMALVVVAGMLATRMHHRNTAFLCAMCDKMFRPPFGQFTFSSHTPKARKLACPACGHTGYCVEVAAEHFTG